MGTRTAAAQVALVLDWASWWAVETGPAVLDYVATLARSHRVFFDANIAVDFTTPDADWQTAGYRFARPRRDEPPGDCGPADN